MKDDESYRVGYKKPPKHTQFKPGHSGNSAGRPKRPQTRRSQRDTLTVLEELLSEKVKIKEGGRSRSRTMWEVMIYAARKKAVEGDRVAARNLMRLTELSGLIVSKSEPKPAPHSGVLVVEPEALHDDAWNPTGSILTIPTTKGYR